MNSSPNPWLLERLVEWQREGLISDSSAHILRDRYASAPSDQGFRRGIASLVMGVLGALLIGSGLIAIIGYNWDEFERPVRLLFAFFAASADAKFLCPAFNPLKSCGWLAE